MENLTIKVTDDQKVVTLLQGEALTPKEPINLSISGNIDTVRRFLTGRTEQIDKMSSHVIIDREHYCIRLITNETDPYKRGVIQGGLEFTEEYLGFQINTGKTWTSVELADYIKMNRSFFETKEVAMNLVKTLRDFKAKIDKEVELLADERGNYNQKRSQIIRENTTPTMMVLILSIFKGQKKQSFEIEISIHPESLGCILVSPDIRDYINNLRDEVIDNEIAAIKQIVHNLTIIEI